MVDRRTCSDAGQVAAMSRSGPDHLIAGICSAFVAIVRKQAAICSRVSPTRSTRRNASSAGKVSAGVYDDDYGRRADAAPLSLSMPMSRGLHDHNTDEPCVRGLLPDSEAVLRRWGRRFGVSANSPFALLSHVGENVAGAAQFVVEDRLSEVISTGAIQAVDEAYIAERLRVLGEDRAAWDDARAPGQFSLAGAQSKLALYRSPTGHDARPHRLGRPSRSQQAPATDHGTDQHQHRVTSANARRRVRDIRRRSRVQVHVDT